jgi:signal transduction histidine kinase
LDRVIGEIRQFIIAEKRVKKRTDFSSVLHAVVQRARAGKPAGITLQCDSDTADRLSQEQAVQLASIAREGLSNSLRHAKPRKVEIALRSDAEAVFLEISDDGDGFDPKLPRRAGLGLASMESRARELGGRLEVQSAPGQGTRLTVHVPTISEEHPETEVSASRERES